MVTGAISAEPLAALFARWVQDHGDLAVWPEATRFGTLVARYSALTTPVAAVWLGLEPDALILKSESMCGHKDQCWTLQSPHGRVMQLTALLKMDDSAVIR